MAEESTLDHQLDGRVAQLPHVAVGKELLDVEAGWGEAKLEVDHGGNTGGLCRAVHVARVLQIHRDRLLAEDVLPGGDGGERDLPVRCSRGDDRDSVQVVAFDEFAVIRGRDRDPEAGGQVGEIGIDAAERAHLPALRAKRRKYSVHGMGAGAQHAHS